MCLIIYSLSLARFQRNKRASISHVMKIAQGRIFFGRKRPQSEGALVQEKFSKKMWGFLVYLITSPTGLLTVYFRYVVFVRYMLKERNPYFF